VKKYAAAIGIVLGTVIGAAIGLPLGEPLLISVGTLVGLIIGYVLSQETKTAEQRPGGEMRDSAERLKQLEELRSKSLIADDEYQRKREEIIARL